MGFSPTLWDYQIGAGHDQRRGQQEGSRRDVTGNPKALRFEPRPALKGDRALVAANIGSELLQHDFRVVPRHHGLDHLRLSRREQSRQQDRRLYLRTGHGKLILDRVERPSADFERRATALRRLDPGAHALQGNNNAGHRAARERLITLHHRTEALPRKDARKHAHRGAGIPRLQLHPVRRRLQPIQSPTMNLYGLTSHVNLHTQFLEAFERIPAVLAGGIPPNLGGSLGQSRDHGVAVGDGFVAGNRYRSLERFCGPDFFHISAE